MTNVRGVVRAKAPYLYFNNTFLITHHSKVITLNSVIYIKHIT